MPQLISGRHVGVSIAWLFDSIARGTPERISAMIILFRLRIQSPEHLQSYLRVCYYCESEGTPPEAPSYDSGYSVKDVLDGKADWTQEEILDFRHWLETSAQQKAWLQSQFEEIDAAIKDHPVWSTAFWTED